MDCEYCEKPNLFNCLIVHRDKIPKSCLEYHDEVMKNEI